MKKIFLLVCLILVILSNSLFAAKNRKAMIIGVQNYESYAPLDCAHGDVDKMDAMLRLAEYEDDYIWKMKDSGFGDNITASRMYSSILAFARGIEKGDKIIFYFSGHGMGDKSGNNYLLGYDGNKDAPEMFSVNINQIKTMLKEKQPAEVVLIIDACRSYIAKEGRDAGKKYETKINTGKGVRIQDFAAQKPQFVAADFDKTEALNKIIVKTIYAASEGQQSFERKDKNNGAFTYYLTYLVDQPAATLEVDMNKDGIISIEDMVAFADSRINDWTKRANLPAMNPVYQTDGGVTYQPFALFKYDAEETARTAREEKKQRKSSEPIFQYDIDAELAKIKKAEQDMSYLNVDLPVYKPQIPENKINIDETDLSSWEIASAQQEEINQKKVTEEHKAAESIAKKKEFESMQSEYNAAIAKLDRTKDLQEKYTILENLRQAVNNARYSESRQKILPLLEPVYQQIKTAKEKQDEEIAEFEDKFVKDLNSMKKMQQSNLPDDVKQKYLSSFKEKWKDIIKNFDKRKYTIRFNKLLNLPIPSLPTVIFYLSKNIKIEMVNIPDKDYIIGKYEITQEQWQAVMGNNPSIFKGSQLPVENVSWEDCQEFIKKINSEIKTQSPIKFRLPTEDEWEYCAFGIEKYEYAGSNNINDVAWYNNNSGGKTNQVGKLLPNDFDLYDMSGNVWEWCEDLFYSFNSRVIKGGSWAGASIVSKVKYRYGYDKNHKVNHIGFRLIADLR